MRDKSLMPITKCRGLALTLPNTTWLPSTSRRLIRSIGSGVIGLPAGHAQQAQHAVGRRGSASRRTRPAPLPVASTTMSGAPVSRTTSASVQFSVETYSAPSSRTTCARRSAGSSRLDHNGRGARGRGAPPPPAIRSARRRAPGRSSGFHTSRRCSAKRVVDALLHDRHRLEQHADVAQRLWNLVQEARRLDVVLRHEAVAAHDAALGVPPLLHMSFSPALHCGRLRTGRRTVETPRNRPA